MHVVLVKLLYRYINRWKDFSKLMGTNFQIEKKAFA